MLQVVIVIIIIIAIFTKCGGWSPAFRWSCCVYRQGRNHSVVKIMYNLICRYQCSASIFKAEVILSCRQCTVGYAVVST